MTRLLEPFCKEDADSAPNGCYKEGQGDEETHEDDGC